MASIHRVGEVYAWIEQESSIHLKAVSTHGDPVELTVEAARATANMLLTLAKQLEEFDSNGSPDFP